ncbi:MAG: hypothetical protein MZU79_06705 [Anaerotruncus sp.]|nr:hypothetical protein [Anaerotruncus sp.]
MAVTINFVLDEQLPVSASAIDSLHRYTTAEIDWNEAELALMTQPGTYLVHGTLVTDESVVITCTVTAVSNYIVDPGLETKGGTTQAVVAPWYATEYQTERNRCQNRKRPCEYLGIIGVLL